MNNTAVSQNVVQGLPASEASGEQAGRSDSGVSTQPTQSRFGGGEGPGFCIFIRMPRDSGTTGVQSHS